MAAQAVHAATQVYLKNDGLRLLRELPDEVLQGLRYYETAATRAPFAPHAPLMGAPLGAQQFYHIVVTDWSLLVVDRGGGGSSILLEVPWLGIQDMECEEADSSEVLNVQGPTFKCSTIRMYPKVDMSKLTVAETQKLQAHVDKCNSGRDITEAIPMSKRIFASSNFPKPLPQPIPPPKDKPYTEGQAYREVRAQWGDQGRSGPYGSGGARTGSFAFASPNSGAHAASMLRTQFQGQQQSVHPGMVAWAGAGQAGAMPMAGTGPYQQQQQLQQYPGQQMQQQQHSGQQQQYSGQQQQQLQQYPGQVQQQQYLGQQQQPLGQQQQFRGQQQQQQQQQQQSGQPQQFLGQQQQYIGQQHQPGQQQQYAQPTYPHHQAEPHHENNWWTAPSAPALSAAPPDPAGPRPLGEAMEQPAPFPTPTHSSASSSWHKSSYAAGSGVSYATDPFQEALPSGYEPVPYSALGFFPGTMDGGGVGNQQQQQQQGQQQQQLSTQQQQWVTWQQQLQDTFPPASVSPDASVQQVWEGSADRSHPGQVPGYEKAPPHTVLPGRPPPSPPLQWVPSVTKQPQWRLDSKLGRQGLMLQQGRGVMAAGGGAGGVGVGAVPGLTWVEEQSLRWQQQQQARQQVQQQAQHQGHGMIGSQGPPAIHGTTATVPATAASGFRPELASSGSGYVLAHEPETQALPSFPDTQAQRPLTWAEQQAVAAHSGRLAAHMEQDRRRQERYQALYGGRQGGAHGRYVVQREPVLRSDLPTLDPQEPYYEVPGVGAGVKLAQAVQQMREREAEMRRQIQLQRLLQQQREAEEKLRKQQEEQRERQMRQQHEFDWVDQPYVPLHLRPPMPSAVRQPRRDEVWRAGDDDPPEMVLEDCLELLPGYTLVLLTIERRSALAFHIRRAWLGAHMRLGLVASGLTGLPLWYLPPVSPFLLQLSSGALRKACAQLKDGVRTAGGRKQLAVPPTQPLQYMQYLAYFSHKVLVVPVQQSRTREGNDPGGPLGIWSLFPSPWPALQPWPLAPLPSVAALIAAGHAGEPGALGSSELVSTLAAASAAQSLQLQLAAASPRAKATPRKQLPPNCILRSPGSEQGQGMPAFMQPSRVAAPGASPLDTLTGRAIPELGGGGGPSAEGLQAGPKPLKEVWAQWEATDGPLKRGGSLFSDTDASFLREMYLEFGMSDTARAHEAAGRLFVSPAALLFVLQRLYAWGAVCALYGNKDPSPGGGNGGSPDSLTPGPGPGPRAPSAYVHWVTTKNRRSGTSTSREAVDIMTGAAQSADEDTYQFFRDLYESSTWLTKGGGAARPRQLLRRLGLLAPAPATLTQTLATIVDTLQRLRTAAAAPGGSAAGGAGGGGVGGGAGRGLRSEPPQPVPQPPTLAPEPLMLSPLRELPYLFALGAPSAADRLLQEEEEAVGAGRGPADPRATYQKEQQFRRQEQLQSSRLGQTLQSSYTDSYLGYNTSDDALELTRAVGLWDRLVGRLCARLAWKQTCLMLTWLESQLAFSEGSQSRALWSTDVALRSEEGRSEVTYQACTRHLIMLCVQLKDPEGWAAPRPSLCAPSRPSGKYDMLYWSAAGVRQHAMDWQASILYELQGICEQGDALCSSVSEALFDQVLQALPVEAANAFAHRMLLRLICLLTGRAVIHGFAPPGSEPRDEPSEGSGRVLVAEVAAYRLARVLATLLKRVPSVAYAIEEPLSDELHHLVRTPETRARLAARSCNAVLSRATLDLLEVSLSSLRGAAAAYQQARAGGASAEAGALSAPHLANRGAIWNFQMPRLLT